MPRAKKKPDYDPEEIQSELLKEISDEYTSGRADSLRKIAKKFGITILKARKLLITAGAYSTELSEQISRLKEEGKSIEEIMQITRLGRASVHSYLPYSRIIYNTREISTDAERAKRYRQRKAFTKNV